MRQTGKSQRPGGGALDKKTSGAKILSFPSRRVIVNCECCGGHFERGQGEDWKRLCRPCWAWDRAGRHLQEAHRLIQEAM